MPVIRPPCLSPRWDLCFGSAVFLYPVSRRGSRKTLRSRSISWPRPFHFRPARPRPALRSCAYPSGSPSIARSSRHLNPCDAQAHMYFRLGASRRGRHYVNCRATTRSFASQSGTTNSAPTAIRKDAHKHARNDHTHSWNEPHEDRTQATAQVHQVPNDRGSSRLCRPDRPQRRGQDTTPRRSHERAGRVSRDRCGRNRTVRHGLVPTAQHRCGKQERQPVSEVYR